MELNEPEQGVAPTDSRLRPDQRLMEQGAWEEANSMKMQLEEKQRAARRRRDSLLEEAAQTGRIYIICCIPAVKRGANALGSHAKGGWGGGC